MSGRTVRRHCCSQTSPGAPAADSTLHTPELTHSHHDVISHCRFSQIASRPQDICIFQEDSKSHTTGFTSPTICHCRCEKHCQPGRPRSPLPGTSQASARTHLGQWPCRQGRACVGHIALRVPEGPDDGVDDELELHGGHGEQRARAGVGDGAQQVEELQPVLRIVLQCAAAYDEDCGSRDMVSS